MVVQVTFFFVLPFWVRILLLLFNTPLFLRLTIDKPELEHDLSTPVLSWKWCIVQKEDVYNIATLPHQSCHRGGGRWYCGCPTINNISNPNSSPALDYPHMLLSVQEVAAADYTSKSSTYVAPPTFDDDGMILNIFFHNEGSLIMVRKFHVIRNYHWTRFHQGQAAFISTGLQYRSIPKW